MTDAPPLRQVPAPAGPRPTFSAVLRPHRSLTPRGFLIVMCLLSAVSFGTGIAFWLIGAWPVLLFCGLDVALVYVAFKLNYRSGLAFETVELTPEQLTLTRIDPQGRRKATGFNPYWVRVELDEKPDGRTDLRVALRQQVHSFGHCLNDDEKREFARALQTALLQARYPDH
jgi:uncharacterized membrane protein